MTAKLHYTHTLSLSLSLSHTRALSLSLSLSLSLTHTHSHTESASVTRNSKQPELPATDTVVETPSNKLYVTTPPVQRSSALLHPPTPPPYSHRGANRSHAAAATVLLGLLSPPLPSRLMGTFPWQLYTLWLARTSCVRENGAPPPSFGVSAGQRFQTKPLPSRTVRGFDSATQSQQNLRNAAYSYVGYADLLAGIL